MDIKEKYNKLRNELKEMRSVLLAYSGGVDSNFLLKAAVQTLGTDKVLACTAVSGLLSERQHKQAIEEAAKAGAKLKEVQIDELDDENFRSNKADKCFHCKSRLFKKLNEIAMQQGLDQVICGSNVDDMDDFRPGNRAAKAFNIKTPLISAGLNKEEIRQISREMGLSTADIPASPCLASRLAYGLEITAEKLKQVEKAEQVLRDAGFVEFRVRHHGDIAKIEVGIEKFNYLMSLPVRNHIVEELKSLGFKFVTLDMEGFQSGSLNRTLSEDEKRNSL
jgi:uncharacterized protein